LALNHLYKIQKLEPILLLLSRSWELCGFKGAKVPIYEEKRVAYFRKFMRNCNFSPFAASYGNNHQ